MGDKIKVELLTKRVKEILFKKEAFVIKLNGKWGVGKTHFWNRFKKAHLDSKKVAYVSLFGKESIEEIRSDIVLQISKKDFFADSVSESISNLRFSMGLEKNEINFNFDTSFLASMMTLLKKKDFRDVIVCFDDFERLSEKLHPKDLLGLISELKEQKNCHVVMILNQDKIRHEALSTYEDKVIDYEFEYVPTLKESYLSIEKSLEVFRCPVSPRYGCLNLQV